MSSQKMPPLKHHFPALTNHNTAVTKLLVVGQHDQIGTHAVASMMSYINYEIMCMHEA